ncbi:MAG: hypothetical protein ACT4OZ_01425 [Gemmatimonadota bacterium]
MRSVIGGVGYRFLRDHSFGVDIADELASRARPPLLLVEDLSYGPVAVAQWFQEESEREPIDRAVMIGAVERGRQPGALSIYRWDRQLPEPTRIQECIVEAVTGIILLDNTLIVCEWMKALPPETIVIEVEPLEHLHGHGFSQRIAVAARAAKEIAVDLALSSESEGLSAKLPTRPLGGAHLQDVRPA